MRLVRRIVVRTPQVVVSPLAFLIAAAVVLGCIAWSFVTHWSSTWLLWLSAIASAATFLIAFSLQYTQNRDTRRSS